MMIFVLGKPDSGKSARAESLAAELSGEGKKLYLATMIPFGEEGEARVRKHREMRKGKGFETIEQPRELKALEDKLRNRHDSLCLLECVANLAGNEMHEPANSGMETDELSELIREEILWLEGQVKSLIVVSDVFEAPEESDEETMRYIRLVDLLNEKLKKDADRVIEL